MLFDGDMRIFVILVPILSWNLDLSLDLGF